jgi:hypothetical protein
MAKKPRTARKSRTKPDVPGASHNSGDERPGLTPNEEQALFLQHRTSWNEGQAKLKAAEKIVADVVAALKADGFTKKQMQIADSLGSLKGEVKIEAEVADRLKVARWIGHKLGAQMDLFEQPDRTPAVDIAYGEGKRASMTNKPARPDYAPSSPQYASYMAGYHDHQRELAGGLRAPEDVNQSTLAHQEA